MSPGLLSSKGVLALLRESDSSVILFALKRVQELMDVFWYEISSDLPVIEELYESECLPLSTRRLAALMVSQVYFHMGAYNESVHFALSAGPAFDGAERSLFTDTILSRCIDQYVEYQEAPEGERPEMDPRLEGLFESLTKMWTLQGESYDEVKELVGFTIRAHRLDFLEQVLKVYVQRTKSADILNFTLSIANLLLHDITFRRRILRMLADLYTGGLETVDYYSLAQCLLFLGDVPATANLLCSLISDGNTLVAYQLSFDLFEYGSQEFLSSLVKEVERQKTTETATADEESAASASSAVTCGLNTCTKLLSVLSGEFTTSLYVRFLYACCVADIYILRYARKSVHHRKAILNTAVVIANAFMYCGTTIDAFLRDNLTWLASFNCWACFTAVASVGVIHRGHTEDAMKVLEPYLRKRSSKSALPFKEAGALYALGLIHSPLGVSRGREVISYLHENLREHSDNMVMAHGASLGIGLAAMGLQDEELYDALFTCVAGCDAVGGEGAAVAIGMLMMGSGNETAIQSLKNLANEDDQKEKVIRGTSMAMAIISLGRENEALPLVNELLESPDPWIRLGGCFVLGLAYAGTENTSAMGRLLSLAVKDTSDDVRRNATIMMGFLTFKSPLLCLNLIRVLVDSYNPHIRYGVALALGISAAGTGCAEIIDILADLTNDLVNYVRQGAFMALSLVMVQLTEKQNPKVKELRTGLQRKIGRRREGICSKLGCIFASGLLDAGGRNCTFALHHHRHRLDKAVVGMFMFSQYWYWYPYLLMVSLAMRPTCFIGLNDDLEMPEYTFKSCMAASCFSVPKSLYQEKKETKAAGHQAVVLSTTRKEEELRQRRKRSSVGDAEMRRESPTVATDLKTDAKNEADQEPNFELLHNPARVTAHQFSFVSHDVDNRYRPLKPNSVGVCLLQDKNPDLGEQKLVEKITFTDRAPMPEPFTYP